MPTVSKSEMAKLLSCSSPTLTDLIARYADFPIVKRGSSGKAWQLDSEAVMAFLGEKQRAAAAASAERDDLLAQATIPCLSTMAIRPADQLALTRNKLLLRREARESGELLVASEVRDALTVAFTELRTGLAAGIRQILRDAGTPQATIRSIESKIEDLQRAFVAKTAAKLRGHGDAGAQP